MNTNNVLDIIISKKTLHIIITSILLLGAGLRFWGITERGFWQWDEAYYSNIAKAPYYLTQRWLNNPNSESVREYILNRGVSGIPFIKPGHVALIAISFFIFGVKDFAPFIMMGLFGTFLIFLIYRLGKNHFSIHIGLASALIAAVSGHLIFYSRSAYPQMDTAVFSLLSLLSFFKALDDPDTKKKYLWLSGGFFSVGVLMHQSLALPMLLLIFYYTWITWNERKNLRYVFSSTLPLWGLPIFVYSIVMALSKLFVNLFPQLLPRTTSDVTLGDRTEQRLTTVFESYSFDTTEILTVLKIIFSFEGILIFILLFFGSYVMIKNRREFEQRKLMLIFVKFWFVILYWSFFSGGHPTGKAFMTVMPQMTLIAGVGAVQLIKRIPNIIGSAALALLLALLIISSSIYNSYPVITSKSGYKEATERAVDYAIKNDLIVMRDQSGLTPLLSFYFGVLYDEGDSLIKSHIDAAAKDMGDIIILDYRMYDKPEKNAELINLVKGLNPLFSIDNDWVSLKPKFNTHYGEIFRVRNKRILSYEDGTKVLAFHLNKSSDN